MELEEKMVEHKLLYKGRTLEFYHDDIISCTGNKATRDYIHHPGGACVLALTNDGKVIMERQYRYPYKKIIKELPAGKINLGEDPMITAVRELEEETGYKANKIMYLGKMYPSVGYADEIIYLYYAYDLEYGELNFDEDERIETYLLSLEELLKEIEDGNISDAKTICAVNLFLLKKNYVLVK